MNNIFREPESITTQKNISVFSASLDIIPELTNGLAPILQCQGPQEVKKPMYNVALEVSEKKLNVIFDNIEAGIIEVSPQGVITFANRRMAEMFAMNVSDLIGSCYFDLLHESEMTAGIENMKQIVDGTINSVELVRHYIRKDGTDFWGHLTGTRFDNNDGSMRDQVIVISDITERRVAENEKKLLEQQLQQAQRLESLGVLAGGIAHDFNNILTIIIGNSNLAKMYPEASENYITAIEYAADRGAGLCRQMLAYAGKAQVEQTKLNLATHIGEIVTMLKSAIPKNATITIENNKIPLIIGDANQISQVIMNLIINASEAIGDAQGDIYVTLATTEISKHNSEVDCFGKIISPHSYVSVEVRDNGVGMDDDTKRRIFEPFYTTKFVGRGLGMSAVIGIITSHCGFLQLQSEKGKGTTFKILLPILEDKFNKDVPQLQPITSELFMQNITVLLVDDEVNVRYIVKKILEEVGATVIEASNGKEAMEIYHRDPNRINLVITDIGMPIMDGYELFEKLREIDSSLPIIISSGFCATDVTARIPKERIAGFIEKPYGFDELCKVLKSTLVGSLSK
ncbi:MAG: response regulator [Chlorobium sp.]|nr:response regulator [Chlorobium sp.]